MAIKKQTKTSASVRSLNRSDLFKAMCLADKFALTCKVRAVHKGIPVKGMSPNPTFDADRNISMFLRQAVGFRDWLNQLTSEGALPASVEVKEYDQTF